MNWLAVGLGAALGAWLRWGFGVMLNAVHSYLPLGTVLANWLGGFLIGIAVAFFNYTTVLNPAWRLFVITGFLGGLTTFSTFSSESFAMLQHGEYLWALGHTVLHLVGSILFCAAGFACYRAIAT
ncbi:MAG: fluoride efflux transporter CrcB [Burkholderiaceae bacterium]|jgi:CrcB protein|nr:fluoride efflux transporter CrcB [Burkholderiaceae bacterium]